MFDPCLLAWGSYFLACYDILAFLQSHASVRSFVLLQAMFEPCFAAAAILACLTFWHVWPTLCTIFWHVLYRDAWWEPCIAMCSCKPCLRHVLQHQPFWHVLLLLFGMFDRNFLQDRVFLIWSLCPNVERGHRSRNLRRWVSHGQWSCINTCISRSADWILTRPNYDPFLLVLQ